MESGIIIFLAGMLILTFGYWVALGVRNGKLTTMLNVVSRNYQQRNTEYQELLAKYERVQNGYDQGVLEGMRQAFTNVRAYLASEMENDTPQNRAFLITWLHPRLSALGSQEHKLLMEMKGLVEAEKQFKKKTAERLGVSEEEEI